MSPAAAWQIDVAIEAALLADPTLAAKLADDTVSPAGVPIDVPTAHRLYSLTAPKDGKLPYLILGDVQEKNLNTFGRAPGHDTTTTIHIWSAKRSKDELLDLYADVERILNRKQLVLAGGHTMIMGYTMLVQLVLDIDGFRTHLIARYYVTSQQ